MQMTDDFAWLRQRREAESAQAHRLAQLAHEWDGVIKDGLQGLGHALWGNAYLLGLIPQRRYRLRHERRPGGYVWWVEHDLAPYDRYRCAAHRVQLTLDGLDQPRLTVQSGSALYPVTPITPETVRAVVARAGLDDPLVIPRAMGAANDP